MTTKPDQKRIEVVIDGKVLTLVSDHSEAYMQQVASYVNKKIAEVNRAAAGQPINDTQRAIKMYLNIADDYVKMQNEYAGLAPLQKEKEVIARKMVMQDKRMRQLQTENEDLKTQLRQKCEELDEYIRNFDDHKGLPSAANAPSAQKIVEFSRTAR